MRNLKAASLPAGYYFWDTSSGGNIYPEGGRYDNLKQLQQVDTNQFIEPGGEDTLAPGYWDGNNFYTVQVINNQEKRTKLNGKNTPPKPTAPAQPGFSGF